MFWIKGMTFLSSEGLEFWRRFHHIQRYTEIKHVPKISKHNSNTFHSQSQYVFTLNTTWLSDLKCIWQIFFICSIKSPQCADKCSKNYFSIAIFLPRVLMCQKRQISLPVGYKIETPKTGDWERLWRQFRIPSLTENRVVSHFLIVS